MTDDHNEHNPGGRIGHISALYKGYMLVSGGYHGFKVRLSIVLIYGEQQVENDFALYKYFNYSLYVEVYINYIFSYYPFSRLNLS